MKAVNLFLCLFFFFQMKDWLLTVNWSSSCFLSGMTKPCSVEVLENVWLHIRDLPFMSKEARNVILSRLVDLILKAVPFEKKKAAKFCRLSFS